VGVEGWGGHLSLCLDMGPGEEFSEDHQVIEGHTSWTRIQ
jgi:hypothetical protein